MPFMPPADDDGDSGPRHGRPPSTTHHDLERLGIEMFTRFGYAKTSVEEIAGSAGISRRTFFRYFPTKADVVWGDFEREIERLRASLEAVPATVPMMTALRHAVVDFNRVPPEETEHHRARLRLILGEPDLIARSMVKFAGWRQVIAEFAGGRLGQEPTDLFPQVVGECALGASVAAYRRWFVDEGAHLSALMDEAFRMLELMGPTASSVSVHEDRE
ncbi:mycofactocin system transcriptional regulator [Georgenia sp. SYP-B2076]|uniref:mycofactocin system transcriptional regulator n=1 Tax=Georgenia sp. SYP-B2076 TaxID=2495881 RepID=UPI000F8E81AC|nr:mycofactocin system transcriptional regulator [Georgenia sp. SYP-B2076]